MIKKIDHIAIAVKNLAEEITRYRDVLGLEYLGSEKVAEQKVNVAFFKINDVLIELLEPTGPDSPVSAFIEKKGGGLHHLALEVDNLQATIRRLQEKNVQMLNSEPKSGAHHSQIAFVHPKSFSGVLFELKQQGDES
ncbi:MAG: methylmalonyl-CoA epimerase [Chrysiogenales bacterium]